jgi:hypothetical protein
MTIKEITKNMEYPIGEFDEDDNLIYDENNDGYWFKREYDENNDGYWFKREYDENNNLIYHKDSNNYWYKKNLIK